ncbi:MAG: peroxiredoxin [Thiobacillaceae bacterium]|nr:peroxiredoxin [Thiobacillaceae bacterium]MCX7672188.1 peroxiredoxin [Thiobacillaceae bacterium]MDW8324063.1 peroxiredoxin [Burkholderiales bacterium]
MLKAGDRAPDFELPDADMEIATLSEYLGKHTVVLYFYVRDNTPACTTEAIEFSDLEDQFARHGAVVLGISRDDCISHGEFRDKHGITVRLLADRDCSVCRLYGVLVNREVEGVERETVLRSTFVIDRTGTIRHALYGVNPKGHAQQVLQLVKELEK